MSTTETMYKVTLNFNFERECGEHDDYWNEHDDSDEGSDASSDEGSDEISEASFETEPRRKAEAFRRTDEYFKKYSIEDHVKENDALSFVEYICSEGEVISAEWDEKKFQIHMVMKAFGTKESVIHDIRNNSLEDGEYEACGETGWIVLTRGPDGEEVKDTWKSKDWWVYGVTDYRSNPIVVEEIK